MFAYGLSMQICNEKVNGVSVARNFFLMQQSVINAKNPIALPSQSERNKTIKRKEILKLTGVLSICQIKNHDKSQKSIRIKLNI